MAWAWGSPVAAKPSERARARGPLISSFVRVNTVYWTFCLPDWTEVVTIYQRPASILGPEIHTCNFESRQLQDPTPEKLESYGRAWSSASRWLERLQDARYAREKLASGEEMTPTLRQTLINYIELADLGPSRGGPNYIKSNEIINRGENG